MQIREGLYHPVATGLSKNYPKLFSLTPFARLGGPRGTTARLTKWFARLAECTNQGHVHPELLASVLTFFEAPHLSAQVDAFPTVPVEVDIEPDSRVDASRNYREVLHECQANVQSLFYEELRKRFEFECAERCFDLQCRGAPGVKILEEVLHCLVENLDDAKVRIVARSTVWDEDRRCHIRLDETRREQLQRDLTDQLEPALFTALAAAAIAGCEDGPCGRSLLASRRTTLQGDCDELLRLKTHLSEECEYLEEQLSQPPASDVSESSSSNAGPMVKKRSSGKSRPSLFRALSGPRKR
jgi:hypothetical protein